MYLVALTTDNSSAPACGRSIYFVVEEGRHRISLLHPWTLSSFAIPVEDYEKGRGDVYWPPEVATSTELTNSVKDDLDGVQRVARTMLMKLEEYSKRGRQHPANLVRRVIAEVQGTTLDKVPVFREVPEATRGNLTKAREARAARKPGVIDAIANILSNENGATVDEAVKQLHEMFPDRESDGMKNTVKCQINRLPKKLNMTLIKTEVKGRGMVFRIGAQ